MRKEYDFGKGVRGAVLKRPGKTRITIHLDNDVIEAFRAHAEEAGMGYQTMINRALRKCLSGQSEPVDAETLRKILREEMKKAG